jgi:hypothetical protein
MVLMVKIQWLTSTKEKEEKIFECFDLTPSLSPLPRFTLSENCLRITTNQSHIFEFGFPDSWQRSIEGRQWIEKSSMVEGLQRASSPSRSLESLKGRSPELSGTTKFTSSDSTADASMTNRFVPGE